ncbi:MAG TPA: ATP-binding protein [Polyangiaceae bacterium]|nr:ATP-binding protein [Polyangiaceae bacterium]
MKCISASLRDQNRLLDRTPLHSRPPRPLPDFTPDETDSGVFQLSDSAVLIFATDGLELQPSARALEEEGFTIVRAASAETVAELAFLPHFGVVEAALPGALDWLRRINLPEPTMQVLVLLGPGESEDAALAAGATLTLRHPFDDQTLLLCLRRFRAHDELVRQNRHVFDQEHGSVPAPVLESVLATIGHEISNPLAAALASVECLRDSDSASSLSAEERAGAVEDTALALRRIQDVMSAVTSLVRGTPPSLERVSLWSAAERAVDALRSDDVRTELAGDRAVHGWASTPLLEQVVINLVKNAIDATRDQDRPQILVRVYRAGLEARISVRDNGPGVPSALRQRIFAPFFSTKGERGTGLGLVLVHHAVERMGGTVSLGAGGAGAVFRVRLRAA